MFAITKDFEFSASHRLEGLPPGHQCGRDHGHNYVVRVELFADDVDADGFVVDYGELSPFKAWIDQHLDHRFLNDVRVLGGIQPTAENLARRLHAVVVDLLERLHATEVTAAVAVSETPKTWARYIP
jgi:6-pyruvoyltetrahydropterin/6-carboxytetrahydropterin synthase